MKKILILLVAGVLAVCSPVVFTSCSSAPSTRVTQVQSIKAVGHSAEAVVSSAAQLYAAGTITAEQARTINDFYDTKFQPAYRLAVVAVNSNLDINAPDQLILLSTQLAALLLQYTQPKTP